MVYFFNSFDFLHATHNGITRYIIIASAHMAYVPPTRAVPQLLPDKNAPVRIETRTSALFNPIQWFAAGGCGAGCDRLQSAPEGIQTVAGGTLRAD